MSLSGNAALITGGATGIGLALAEAFLAARRRLLSMNKKGANGNRRKSGGLWSEAPAAVSHL